MRIIVFLPIFIFCVHALGQTPVEEKRDSLKVSFLDEIVVSANKIPEARRTVAQQINIITPSILKNSNAQTSADLLQNTGLVAIQRSQQGGGSPILRGFEASRVLLMVDGVRLNNLIYRAGHLQSVITVDNNVLERVEVLFGPSSTVYGSDALGGVVHFYTRNPKLAIEKNAIVIGNVYTRFGSVNNEKTAHADFVLSGRKFGSLTSFTNGNFGDLKMGKKINPSLGEAFGLRPFYTQRLADNSGDELIANEDPYVQKSSGYKQYDFVQKFLFKQNTNVQHILNFQYSTSTNIPRYDRLTDPQGNGLRSAQWYYGPQKRMMASYQLNLKNFGAFADGVISTMSYQAVEESRHDRRFNRNNLNHRTEKVDVYAFTLDLQKNISGNKIRYGFDSQFNQLKSVAFSENIITKVNSALDTRYPNGHNRMAHGAVYATHTLEINNHWTLNDGVRLGGSILNSTFVDKAFFPFPFEGVEQKNFYGSGNLGMIFTPSSWKFSLMSSTGYRVPNVDDLSKVFESQIGSSTQAGTLFVPNPELKPEKTFNLDFGVTRFFHEKVRIEGLAFATQMVDAIAVRPSTFNGQSQILYNGFSANVVSSQNVNRAFIYGWNGQVRIDPVKSLTLVASYTYTHGQAKGNGENLPLDHIAPQFGRVSMAYTTSKFMGELFGLFNGRKYVSDYSNSGEDNLQYATPTGMPSWYTLNLRLSYEFNKHFTFQSGIDNIMDLQYRVFGSGINAPGRNLFGTLRFKFGGD